MPLPSHLMETHAFFFAALNRSRNKVVPVSATISHQRQYQNWMDPLEDILKTHLGGKKIIPKPLYLGEKSGDIIKAVNSIFSLCNKIKGENNGPTTDLSSFDKNLVIKIIGANAFEKLTSVIPVLGTVLDVGSVVKAWKGVLENYSLQQTALDAYAKSLKNGTNVVEVLQILETNLAKITVEKRNHATVKSMLTAGRILATPSVVGETVIAITSFVTEISLSLLLMKEEYNSIEKGNALLRKNKLRESLYACPLLLNYIIDSLNYKQLMGLAVGLPIKYQMLQFNDANIDQNNLELKINAEITNHQARLIEVKRVALNGLKNSRYTIESIAPLFVPLNIFYVERSLS